MTEEQVRTAELYRHKAEELRTQSADFHSLSAKESIEKTAKIWDRLADDVEHRT